MDETQEILHCSLEHCQTLNHLASKCCSHCQTPLIKRYLWVVGASFNSEAINQLVADRYFVVSNNLVLDTQPGVSPYFPDRIPSWLKPYLKLTPQGRHIPKVYGQIPSKRLEVWLLEYESFSASVQQELAKGNFLPTLAEVWETAPAIRQLNWLLQISQLWQPLHNQKVTRTLITPELLRVNDSVIQLRELTYDGEQKITLQDLGKLWSTWIDQSQPKIQSFFQEVCDCLLSDYWPTSEGLTHFLEDGLRQIGRSQSRIYEIASMTDSGPSRSHNEDAYYQQEAINNGSSPQEALAIVCDGVGGHKGGAIASKLAIENLQREIETIEKTFPNSRILAEKIKQAVGVANDVICQENDVENRQAQERMATTLVMALARDYEMYVTHVGDSRVYWITASGCYQLTLDDDLASRQTRLGHLLYREALRQPSAGALIQALGVSSSKFLHPTTQRLIIDEDCVFLLCSDGLSDNQLVEQYWEKEILPILEEEKELSDVAQRLIDLANRLNGHDNVTVSLMKCSVSFQDENTVAAKVQEQTRIQPSPENNIGSTITQAVSKKWRGFPLILLLCILILGGVGIAYWSLHQFQKDSGPERMRDPSDLLFLP